MTRIAFTTNLCAHYNVGTFELLSRKYEMDFYFFSAGNEWYWPREHGIRSGDFRAEYLPGFQLGRTRITPSLVWKLLKGDYDVYIKCINGRFALPLTYLIACIKRKPFILWTGVWCRLRTPIQRLVFPFTRYIYHHSDAIVVYGEHVKEYLVGEGVPAERIFVALHAVNNDFYSQPIPETEKSALHAHLNISQDKKIILYLGRLEESKGVQYLVEAFAQLNYPDAVLVIAGDGGLIQEIKELVKKLKIWDKVRFVGYVPIESAPLYYSLAWVYVLPSISASTGKEPWGLVVNEAMNQGVPVIATDSVGAAAGGLVQDGRNGFIIPERNSQAIMKALVLLLDDRELRQRLSENAKRVVAEWNYENNVLGYSEAIEYVLPR